MRQLCSFDGEIQAQQFAAYLFLMGIHTTIDVETTADAPALSSWVVWILEEDDLVQAQEELDRFLQERQQEEEGEERIAEDAKEKGTFLPCTDSER